MSVGQDGTSAPTSDTDTTPLNPSTPLPEAGVGAGSPEAVPVVGAPTPAAPASAASRETQTLGNASPSAPNLTTTQAIAGTAMLLGLLLIAYFVRSRLGARRPPRGEARPSGSADDAELLSDIRELTDRLAADLDAKAERLEALLRAADERIRVLEQVKETRLIEPKTEPRRMPTSEGPHRDVYDLADQGLTVIEIAKRLDRPTGQVELILNLRKGTVAL